MTSTNTTIQTRHDRRITVEHRDENTILEVVNTSTGRVLGAGLTPAEAHQLAAALTGDQVGECGHPNHGNHDHDCRPFRAPQDGSWSLPDLGWLRSDLANQPPAGQWTRDDLPSVPDLVKASVDAMATELGGGADAALDAVVAHLNAHHPMPQPYDQGGVRGADSLLYRAERERDAAVARAEQMEKKLAKVMSDYQDVEDERDAAVARAEKAERVADSLRKILKTQQGRVADAEKGQSAPAVSRADIEKAIRGKVWAANREPNKAGFHRVHVDWATDAVWSLVSGADPAVHVVRESDLPMVSRGEDEHWRDEGGKYVVWGTHTLESAKANVKIQLRHAAEFEAVARAIEAEAAVDPVEKKARELAAAGGIDFDEQEPDGVEMLIGMARHVLGQEADQ